MRKFLWLLPIIISSLFFGCDEDEIGLNLTGGIKGNVNAYNLHFDEDNDSILVTIKGSDPLIAGYTDSLGNYEIIDIPSGTYNIIFTKDGYGETQIQGVQIVGGGEAIEQEQVIISEIPKVRIENFSSVFTNNIVELKGSFSYSTCEYFYMTVFLSDSPNVSKENYKYQITRKIENKSFSFYLDDLITSKYSGLTIYICACLGYPSVYYDIESNKNIYTGYGESSETLSVPLQ